MKSGILLIVLTVCFMRLSVLAIKLWAAVSSVQHLRISFQSVKARYDAERI